MAADLTVNMTFKQALDMQSACMIIAAYYAGKAKQYPLNDDMRAYFEKRQAESLAGAETLRQAMHNPAWQAQLDIIHEASYDQS